MSKNQTAFGPSDFDVIGLCREESEKISRPYMGYWKEALERLRKTPSAVICVLVLAAIILGAVFLPMISPFDYAYQNVAFANQPFFSTDPINSQIHIFGTDYLGRDIFVRIWYGARVSLTVAFAVAIIDCLIGVIYGGISGYIGGAVDNIMMRVLEVIGGIPYLIVVLLLMAVLSRGIVTLIIAYSITGWTGMARLVRGQVVSMKQQEFVVAARIMGAGSGRIIFRHLIPNMAGLIIVNITLDIPSVIFTEAFLSLLGMGIAPPYPSWGIMANEGISKFQSYPVQLVIPALFISLTMLTFNLLGDRFQEVLDPKLRRPVSNG